MKNPIRYIFDATEPWFSKGGRFEKLYPLCSTRFSIRRKEPRQAAAMYAIRLISNG